MSLRLSDKKPTLPFAFARTALRTTTSASEPWKLSTECTPGRSNEPVGVFVNLAHIRFSARFAKESSSSSSARMRRTCSA